MVVTKNREIAKRCRVMRLHGISRDAFDRYTSTKPAWHYGVIAPGFKYNMTDLAASLGIHQLRKAWMLQKQRAKMAQRYDEALAGLPLLLPPKARKGDAIPAVKSVSSPQKNTLLQRRNFKMSRILLVTNGNYFSRIILSDLIQSSNHVVTGAVIVNGDYQGNTGLNSLLYLAKKTAPSYLFYKIFIYLFFKIARYLFSHKAFEVVDSLKEKKISYFLTAKINSSEAINYIKSQEPDLIVSVSCPQRISKKTLEISKLGNINIHSSLLPEYAGLAPYFWVLARGEKVTGTTVHYMTEKFDEGKILVQTKFEIKECMSAFVLFQNLALLGSKAIVKAIDLVEEGFMGIPQDLTKKSYFSHPDRKSYISLKSKGHRLVRLFELLEAIKTHPNVVS